MKESEGITDAEKEKITEDLFKHFCDSLGPNDVYKQVFLEELFKFILGSEE